MKPYIYKYPNMVVNMDVVQIARRGRYNKVLTIVDRFTKYVVFAPILDERAPTLARVFFEKYVSI